MNVAKNGRRVIWTVAVMLSMVLLAAGVSLYQVLSPPSAEEYDRYIEQQAAGLICCGRIASGETVEGQEDTVIVRIELDQGLRLRFNRRCDSGYYLGLLNDVDSLRVYDPRRRLLQLLSGAGVACVVNGRRLVLHLDDGAIAYSFDLVGANGIGVGGL